MNFTIYDVSGVESGTKTERRTARQTEYNPAIEMPEAYQATAVYPAMRHRATEAPSLTTDAAYYSNIVMDTSSQTNQESTGDYDHYDRLDEYEGPVTNAESRRPLPATPTVYERPYRASTNAEIHRPLPPPPPPPVYDCLVR